MANDFELPELPELPSDEELGIADEGTDPTDGAGARDGRPVQAWRGMVTLLVLLGGIWLTSSARSLPSPRAANAPDSVFSSARAMTVLNEIARRPHPPGSPEHDRVRDVLVGRLSELGLTPEVHTHLVARTPAQRTEADKPGAGGADAGWTDGAPVTVATVRNVLARVPGSASTGTMVLLAHYDSRTVSRGAGDDGTGVVAILETLRALRDGPAASDGLALRNDLLVLLTDAEELGLFGARAFVEQHLDTADVQLVLNVEMRGGGGPSLMFETGRDNGWAVARLADIDPHPAANSMSLEVYRRMPNDTDFSPFRDAGVQGLNFAAIGRGNVYHQAYDDPAHLDEATVQHHGARLLAAVEAFGNDDLSAVYAPDRAYWVLPLLGMQSLPMTSMPLVGGFVALLLVVTLLAVLARGIRVREVVVGAVTAVAVALASAGLGALLLRSIQGQHPEFGALHGAAVHHQGWYLAALAAGVAALAAGLWSVMRRRHSIAGLALGAALLPALGALVLAFAVPGATMVLAGPAAVLLVATLITGLAGRRAERSVPLWLLHLLAALVALAFLVPILELVGDAMTLAFALGLGGLFGLAALCISPALDGLRAPNSWALPTVLLLFAGALLGNGLRLARPDSAAPAPSTLTYLQDQGAPGVPVQAWWVSAFDGGLPWAEARTGASFTDSVPDPDRWGLPAGLPAAAARAITLQPPRIALLADSAVGAGRRVRFGIPFPRSPERLGVTVDSAAGIVHVDGLEFAARDSRRPVRLTHLGRPTDSLLTIEVEMPLTAEALEIQLQEEIQRPWELLGDAFWQRPAELAPNIRTQSDRALIRSFHRILLSQDSVP